MQGSVSLLAVLLIGMFALAIGCDELTTTPRTCEELAPHIIDLSEENESPS